MTRTMGDSVTVGNIPFTVDIAAVYINGIFAADPQVVARRFPADRHVTVWIDVNGTMPQRAQVFDVEKGNGIPANAPAWIDARRAVVHTSLPTIYCGRATLPAVEAACKAAGLLPARDYQLWISTLDGTHYTGPGVVACQYQGGPTAKYDLSVVYDDAWHPLPKP